MVTVLRSAVLVGFFAVSVACHDQATLTAPSPSPGPPPPPPVALTPFPPLGGATTTYHFRAALDNFGSPRVSTLTEGSSFVLYESGGFYLQYEAIAQRGRGRYEYDEGRIAFYFSEHSTTADAIGTLKGHLLEVRYSENMQHADFENAAYQRVE